VKAVLLTYVLPFPTNCWWTLFNVRISFNLFSNHKYLYMTRTIQ